MSEKLIYNAVILRISSDEKAEAVAFKNGRITFVGSTEEGKARNIPPENCIDLKGKTLIPGFNDNHLHIHSMADFLSRPDLKGLSCPEIIEKLQLHFRDCAPGETVSGMGWDYPFCPEPHKDILDRAFPENPVVLFQFSGHGAWVNSQMLARLGITRNSHSPAGGDIVRDKNGNPSGILKDAAVTPLHEARFKEIRRSRTVRRRLFNTAQDYLIAAGLTSLQDNTWYPASARDLIRLEPYSELKLRITCWSYGSKFLRNLGMRTVPFSGSWVRRGPVKYFVDGTFSTRTAWLKESYPENSRNFGSTAFSENDLVKILRKNALKGRQAAFHVIGDRAVGELAAAAERVSRSVPEIRNLRFRAEHAQLIKPADIPLLKAGGIIVSAQPHAMASLEKDTAILGPERAGSAYPYRSLLDAGIPLSFGSDVPGEATYAPLYGIHLAVNRASGEAITPLEALRAYTLGSAHAEFMEKEKGSIDVGKLADFTVLSQDPTIVDTGRIRDIPVEATYVGGRQVFSRRGAD